MQSFRDVVATCLVKDPKKRPSSEKLLKHPFFKHAKSADYVSRTILEGLSPLADGFRMLKVTCILYFRACFIFLLHKLHFAYYIDYIICKDRVHFPG